MAAVTYPRHGTRVVAVDRVKDAAQETSDFVNAEGHHTLSVQADVTQTESVAAAVKRAVQDFGCIDNQVTVALAMH